MKEFAIIFICTWLLAISIFYFSTREQPIGFLKNTDNEKARTIDSLKNVCDSLYAELYPALIELNRYQVTLDLLKAENPKAAAQFEAIMNTKTE